MFEMANCELEPLKFSVISFSNQIQFGSLNQRHRTGLEMK